MNYNEVESRLQGRNHTMRKYANNTYLVRNSDNLALRYHNTDVVKFYPNGNIVLDNGGWYTSTTKERINYVLPNPFYLTQSKGVWYIHNRDTHTDFRFNPGMIIKANGSIKGAIPDNQKADRQYKAKVKAYSQLCANTIPLDKPDAGDCWYCYMVTQDGQSLGDAFKDTEHLDSHIEESYIVPSLVYHALKQYGNTDFIMSLVFNNPNKAMLDIAKQRVQKSVYRYILQRKGYAV